MAAVLTPSSNTSSQENIDLSMYNRIKPHAIEDNNCEFLAVIMSSWMSKKGALPQYLGLAPAEYHSLLETYFPGLEVDEKIREDLEQDPERLPEMDDLINLLNRYRAGVTATENYIISIITAACMGSDHLWQDLGFWNRGQLSEMIAVNFPALAEKNNKNMKWKKFLYKQLCEEEGIYTCRSPSCEVCADYTVCFGSEE